MFYKFFFSTIFIWSVIRGQHQNETTLEPPFILQFFLPQESILRDKVPLLAGFNLPVLPLGSDVVQQAELPYDKIPFSIQSPSFSAIPGKGYWLSSSIYRFDPDDYWPTDTTIKVFLNSDLTSTTGQHLVLNGSSSIPLVTYTTEILKFSISSVWSDIAFKSTGGQWRPELPSSIKNNYPDKSYEILPDGVLQLTFNRPVRSLGAMNYLLEIIDTTSRDTTTQKYNIYQTQCRQDNSILKYVSEKDACIRFIPPLRAAHNYNLRIKSHYVSRTIQVLSNTSYANLTGILPFVIAPNTLKARSYSSSYRTLRIELRHGLESRSMLTPLIKQLKITSTEEWIPTPTINAYTFLNKYGTAIIDLETNNLVVPGAYFLTVSKNSDIHDAFGQPLQSSSIPFQLGIIGNDDTIFYNSSHALYTNHQKTNYWKGCQDMGPKVHTFMPDNGIIRIRKNDTSQDQFTYPFFITPKFGLVPNTNYSLEALQIPVVYDGFHKTSTKDISIESALALLFQHDKLAETSNVLATFKNNPQNSFRWVTQPYSHLPKWEARAQPTELLALHLNKADGDFHLVITQERFGLKDHPDKLPTIKKVGVLFDAEAALSYLIQGDGSNGQLSIAAVASSMFSNAQGLNNVELSLWQIDETHYFTEHLVGNLSPQVFRIPLLSLKNTTIYTIKTSSDGTALLRINVNSIVQRERERIQQFKEIINGTYFDGFFPPQWVLIGKVHDGEVMISDPIPYPILRSIITSSEHKGNNHDDVNENCIILPHTNATLCKESNIFSINFDRGLASPNQNLAFVGNYFIFNKPLKNDELTYRDINEAVTSVVSLDQYSNQHLTAIPILALRGWNAQGQETINIPPLIPVTSVGNFMTEMTLSNDFPLGIASLCSPLIALIEHISDQNTLKQFLETMTLGLQRATNTCPNKEHIEALFNQMSGVYFHYTIDTFARNGYSNPSILIAEPRNPTFEITMDGPKLLRPDSQAILNILLKSYTSRPAIYRSVNITTVISLTTERRDRIRQQSRNTKEENTTVIETIQHNDFNRSVVYYPSENVVRILDALKTDNGGHTSTTINLKHIQTLIHTLYNISISNPSVLKSTGQTTGETGELITKHIDIPISETGYYVYLNSMHQMNMPSVKFLKSTFQPMGDYFPQSPDVISVRYTLINIQAEREQSQLTCSTLMGILNDFSTIAEGLNALSHRELDFYSLRQCTSVEKSDFQCLAYTLSSDRGFVFVEAEIVNPIDENLGVTKICGEIFESRPFSETVITPPIATTQETTYGPNELVRITFTNPFLGLVDIQSAEQQATMFYSLSVGFEPVYVGAMPIPILDNLIENTNIQFHETSRLLKTSRLTTDVLTLPKTICSRDSVDLNVIIVYGGSDVDKKNQTYYNNGVFSSSDMEITLPTYPLSIVRTKKDPLISVMHFKISVNKTLCTEGKEIYVDFHTAENTFQNRLSLETEVITQQKYSTDDINKTNSQSIYEPRSNISIVITAEPLLSSLNSMKEQKTFGLANVLVIDRAVLDLKDVPLSSYNIVQQIPLEKPHSWDFTTYAPSNSWQSTIERTGSMEALQAVFSLVLKRLKKDPAVAWDLDLSILPAPYIPATLDQTDEEFFKNKVTTITDAGFRLFVDAWLPLSGVMEPMMLARSGNRNFKRNPTTTLMLGSLAMQDEVSLSYTPNDKTTSQTMIRVEERNPLVAAKQVALRWVDGKLYGETELQVPDTPTTYEIRVLVNSIRRDTFSQIGENGHLMFGLNKTTFISARKMYLKPLVPRLLRPKDIAEIGALVSIDATAAVNITEPVKVAVMVELTGSELLDENTKTISITPGATGTLRFKIMADDYIGNTTATFSLIVDGRVVDAVSSTFPVAPLVQSLTLATTVFINQRGDEPFRRTEALALPRILPGFGGIDMYASLGFAGATQALAGHYIDSTRYNWTSILTEQNAEASLAYAWARNSQNSASLSIPPRTSVDSTVLLLALVTEMSLCIRAGGARAVANTSLAEAARVARFTLPYYRMPDAVHSKKLGLLLYPWWTLLPSFPSGRDIEDISIAYEYTSHAMAILQTYRETMQRPYATDCIQLIGPELAEFRDRVVPDLLGKFGEDLRRGITHTRFLYHNQTPSFMEFFGFERWAQMLRYMGADFFETFPGDIKNELSVSRYFLLRNRELDCRMNVEDLSVAIALSGAEKPSPVAEFVQQCYRNTIYLLRVQSNAAYIARSVTDPNPAENTVQALALELLTRKNSDRLELPPVSMLPIYLSQGGARSIFPIVGIAPAKLEVLHIIRSLTMFDIITNPGLFIDEKEIAQASPLNLNITGLLRSSGASNIQNYIVLSAQFTSEGEPPYHNYVSWTSLNQTSQNPVSYTIDLITEGYGSAYVTTQVSFVPDVERVYPSYKGILVAKQYHAFDPITKRCVGPSVFYATSGETMCIIITLTTKDTIQNVTVIDYLPGGLEALDPYLHPDIISVQTPFEAQISASVGNIFSVCSTPEIRSSEGKSIWNCISLKPGATTLRYIGVVNTPGAFGISPTLAYSASQLGTMGLSAGQIQSFVVGLECNSWSDCLESYGVQEPSLTIFNGTSKSCPPCALQELCNTATGECYVPESLIQ